MTIPGRETRAITVKVRLPGEPGQFTRKAVLWTDREGARMIRFTLTGRTMPKQNEEETARMK